MAIKGQRAAVLCSLGDTLVYTAPQSTADTVTISFASIDNTPITMKLYHIKQGNNGAIPHEPKDLLASPMIIDTRPVYLKDLHISSLDDIVVNSSVADKLAVTINGSDSWNG